MEKTSVDSHFREIVDKIEDGIMVVSRNGKILYANHTAVLMFDLQESDGEYGHFGFPLVRGTETEMPIEHPNGVSIIASVRVVEFKWQGEEVNLLAATDITAVKGINKLKQEILSRHKTERELQNRTLELERSNKELEQFAYAASHDLQEPLRKINAFSDLLIAKCQNQLSFEASDYLKRMKDASCRMSRLIKDLLDLARVDMKPSLFNAVSLNEQMELILPDFELQIKEKQARIECGNLPEVKADPVQVRQLLHNLISNALKYSSKELPPDIRIRAKSLQHGMIELSVEDNGIGFDEQNKERIFKPFQRLHSREDYPGTGIGLSICKKIVERYGGQMSVSSCPGKGSVFRVELPGA
ncbi:MAG: PAS domain-containing protein [Candidatus Omnitrophica bacterium]|nr:PAS domain-containing protein [Candidatus Omnitrophota bacterium]